MTKLGLDVGALTIKAAYQNGDGEIKTIYRFHKGAPEKTVLEIIKELGCEITQGTSGNHFQSEILKASSETRKMNKKSGGVARSYVDGFFEKSDEVAAEEAKLQQEVVSGGTLRCAVTGSGGRRFAEKLNITYVDPAVALVAASRDHANVRHIIDIGGGSLSVVDLDEEGRFAGFRANSLCAAGTGSFLDEQSSRMKLTDEERSKEYTSKEPPRIAARCAVFAKSDLIHRQQEGYSVSEMWSGLCRGTVTSALSTLFRGRKPSGLVIVSGGVALNKEVVKWLKTELGAELIVPADAETFCAKGLLAAAREVSKKIEWQKILDISSEENIPTRPTLEITKSNYPIFESMKNYVDDGTEVRVHKSLEGGVVVGLDIGSTSTKAVIVNTNGEVLADLYRRTSGDPIVATQKIFTAISRAVGVDLKFPVPGSESLITIRGIATTGSGRKMIGAIIGADRVTNEISAHAKGAAVTDPDVQTIFEIGGQDAKFISMRDGSPHDSNMNYVCAAGTGSFVEEQAGKLGFALTEIGQAVIGTNPPFSSDRCTVFMEQDVHTLIRAGFSRQEVMGSVLYSVVQNYLNRVVGRRPYSREKICFMGATARNKGLVAAFEKLLDTPITVSPYCHVMGALGVAHIVLEEVAKKNVATKFRGLSFANEKVELKRDVCELCQNYCRVTKALVGEVKDEGCAPSWGYLCGRDPDDRSVKVSRGFDHFRKRDRLWKRNTITKNQETITKEQATTPVPCPVSRVPNIGIPRALLTYGNFPFWSEFFKTLGVKVVLSKPTDENTLNRAIDWIGSDYCYPLKLAHGHVRDLVEDENVSAIFLPYIVQEVPHEDGFKRNVYCPYNAALPSIIKSSGIADEKTILTAVLNFQLDLGTIVKELGKELVPALKVDLKDIERAYFAAQNAQQLFDKDCENVGFEGLKKIKEKNGCGVVIFGRPYNVHDLGSNLNLPQKISDLGLDVLSVDMLPLGDVKLDPMFQNMYWKYGRKILKAAALVKDNPNLYAVFLTNFGCGPDSFLQSYVEKIMRGKPMLMLEIDEHSADAGYITRLEAFKDVIDKGKRPEARGQRQEKTLPHPNLPLTKGKETSASDSRTKNEERTTASFRTLWVPPMHPYGAPLLAAGMRRAGISAKALPGETIETFEMAKRYCRGTECVPLPATIGAFLNVLKKSDAPEKEGFFMPSARGPCRFGQYNTLHKMILADAGYPDSQVISWNGDNFNFGLGTKASMFLYNAIVSADLLFKVRCRVRPYAEDVESFDIKMASILKNAEDVVESGGDLERFLRGVSDDLTKIKKTTKPKPLIGIVGEIYVRLNTYTNDELVRTIEEAGGEAWVAPISEWFHYLSFIDKMNSTLEKKPLKVRAQKTFKNIFMMRKEKTLIKCLMPIIGDRLEPSISSTVEAGERFFPRQFDGESILTVGRAVEFAANGVDLIINCAPFGCMPGTLTAGIFQKIEGMLKVPVVSFFFDGETDLRPLVRTYVENLKCHPRI